MTNPEYFESERQKELPYLETAVMRYDMIFADTSSIMNPCFAKFAANIIPLFKKHQKKLYVCSSVLRELNKLRQKTDLESGIIREVYSTMGLYVLDRFNSHGVLAKIDDGIEDGPADFAFQKLFIGLRPQKRLLLISQDGNLTNTILRFNLDRSVYAEPIGVKQINPVGFLDPKSQPTPALINEYKAQLKKNPSHGICKPVIKSPQATPTTQIAAQTPTKPTVQLKAMAVKKAAAQIGKEIAFTSKDAKAFEGESLEIPEGYSSIGYLDRPELTSIKVPGTVTVIGEQAFKDCSALSSLELPPSVVSIGSSAFLNCRSLSEFTAPESLTAISNGCFRYCTSLRIVNLHDGITGIGSVAFKGCSKLLSLQLSDNVTSIGRGAFNGCPELVVRCRESSYAHGYCLVNKIKFELIPKK